jgi:hypothetical protein
MQKFMGKLLAFCAIQVIGFSAACLVGGFVGLATANPLLAITAGVVTHGYVTVTEVANQGL